MHSSVMQKGCEMTEPPLFQRCPGNPSQANRGEASSRLASVHSTKPRRYGRRAVSVVVGVSTSA